MVMPQRGRGKQKRSAQAVAEPNERSGDVCTENSPVPSNDLASHRFLCFHDAVFGENDFLFLVREANEMFHVLRKRMLTSRRITSPVFVTQCTRRTTSCLWTESRTSTRATTSIASSPTMWTMSLEG